MTHEFWFKPKTYGYGAAPVTWEGWVLVAAYVLVISAAMVVFSLHQTWLSAWLLSMAAIAASTAAMVMVSVRKTDGGWRWSWGATQNSSKNSRKHD
jgi:hypothetical protein